MTSREPGWIDRERVGTFKPRIEDAVAARRFAFRAMQAWGLECDEVVLAVNELAANAFIHGGTSFAVTLIRDEGEQVIVEVADECSRPPFLSSTGWGLKIIDDLSKDWGFNLSSQGKVVWAVFECSVLG